MNKIKPKSWLKFYYERIKELDVMSSKIYQFDFNEISGFCVLFLIGLISVNFL
jgi:hypothetical protein